MWRNARKNDSSVDNNFSIAIIHSNFAHLTLANHSKYVRIFWRSRFIYFLAELCGYKLFFRTLFALSVCVYRNSWIHPNWPYSERALFVDCLCTVRHIAKRCVHNSNGGNFKRRQLIGTVLFGSKFLLGFHEVTHNGEISNVQSCETHVSNSVVYGATWIFYRRWGSCNARR